MVLCALSGVRLPVERGDWGIRMRRGVRAECGRTNGDAGGIMTLRSASAGSCTELRRDTDERLLEREAGLLSVPAVHVYEAEESEVVLRDRLVVVLTESASLANVTTVSVEDVDPGGPGRSGKEVRVVDAGLISIGESVFRKSRYAGGGERGVFSRFSSSLMNVGVPATGVRSSEGKFIEVADTGVLSGGSLGFSVAVVAMTAGGSCRRERTDRGPVLLAVASTGGRGRRGRGGGGADPGSWPEGGGETKQKTRRRWVTE